MENLTVQAINAKYTSLEPVLDERARRLWAAVEARAIGRGGISRVAEATGLSRVTIRAGLKELDPPGLPPSREPATGRLRRPGGGRKPLTDHDPDLLRDLGDPGRSGDPWRPDVAAAVDVQECAQAGGRTPGPRGMPSATGRSADSSTTWATASRPTARRSRARATPTATPSSSTSTGGSGRSRGGGSRWSRWTPRRRSWSGEFRNGGREWQPEGQPEEVRGLRLPRQGAGQGDPLRGLRPDGRHRAGSAWGSITTRPSSPWRRSGGGGGAWGSRVYPAGEASC